MYFVKTEDLKAGQRLARPIYNHNGVLLFEQGSKLTSQGLTSIANFGLIGMYILEPAEPIPPMTPEDVEFERFQSVFVYQIETELKRMIESKKINKLSYVVSGITKMYGHMEGKINFIQTPRSKEDYYYKHTLNVAILCTLICYRMKLRLDECEDIILAALLHDIGKINWQITHEGKKAADQETDERTEMRKAENFGFSLIEELFSTKPNVRRYCQQAYKMKDEFENGMPQSITKPVEGSSILLIANYYDSMTSVSFEEETQSEVYCVKRMMAHPEVFSPKILRNLTDSINVIVPGLSIELNSGDKALVLTQNPDNILRPMVLLFRDNTILDLGISENEDLEIVDIMKTLDNRCIIDTSTLQQMGFQADKDDKK